jgi:hypothetical protein
MARAATSSVSMPSATTLRPSAWAMVTVLWTMTALRESVHTPAKKARSSLTSLTGRSRT